MKITVPTTTPTITSYPTYASLLSVTDLYLQSDYEIYMNWFMLQFVNTIYFEDTGYIIFDNVLKENTIEYCDIIDREVYNGVQMQQFGINFFDFFIEHLKNGYAIFLRINQKYIPQANKDYDFNHEVLITDYDSQKDSFAIWDFFDGRKYDCIDVSWTSLSESLQTFALLNHPDNPNSDKTSKIIAFRLKESSRLETRYDFHLFSFLIERWLTGEKVGNHCYGSLCYDLIKNNIEANRLLDMRTFHLLFDHKAALQKTVSYLMHTNKIDYNQSLLHNIETLKKLTFISRNLFLKYNLKGTNDDLGKQKILNNWEQLIHLDKETYTQLMKILTAKKRL